jgi:tetratricopeptide (TPR) repeat protein
MRNKLDQVMEKASALEASGDGIAAAKLLERLLSRDPWHVDATIRLANIEISREEYGEAISRLERLLRVKRDAERVRTTLMTAYIPAHRSKEALALAQPLVSARPDDAWLRVLLARVLIAHDDLGAAHIELEHALALNPGVAEQGEIQYELGRVLEQQGRYEESLSHYQRAISLVPHLAHAHEALGCVLLRLGRFAQGWQEYEWRRHTPRFKHNMPPAPPEFYWTGREDLVGHSILVLNEQGLGDGIQFSRYLPQLKSLGAQVIYGVWHSLQPLISSAMPGIRVVTGSIQGLQTAYLCSVLSLPAAFKTNFETMPAKIPYLYADPERMQRWWPLLADSAGCRIGLAWAGKPGHGNDSRRSVSAQTFLGIMAAPDATFYSLQHQVRESDRAALDANKSLVRIGEMTTEFADIAAIIAQLDLVITVDTSIAHLAGALGKPVWILLPFVPDWRWFLDRDDSPWYRTARLFRQPAAGAWGPVIERVRAEVIRGTWRRSASA